jgi:hypothetical protein
MATTKEAESLAPFPRETVSKWVPSGYVGDNGIKTTSYGVELTTVIGCRSSVTSG